MSARSFSQKYTVIQHLEDMPEGTAFSSSDWPLHVTIVDTFAVDWDAPTMIGRLESLLANHYGAASATEGDTFFWARQTDQGHLTPKD